MKIKITYLATVIASLILLFIGHKIAVQGLVVFQDQSRENVNAKVQRIIEKVTLYDDFSDFRHFDDIDSVLGEKIIFEARVTSGRLKGEVIIAEQAFSRFFQDTTKEVAQGDSVLLINSEIGWYFNGYRRINKMIWLGLLFVLSVLFFGRKKGFNTILSLSLTCAAVFAVFIPSILSGKNIYLMALLVCAYTTVMTLTIVSGYNKKSLAAVIGCLSGIVAAGLITIIMDRILLLTGIVDEHSRYLLNLPVPSPINLKAIIFAGIIIGAMGAIMDVAMSISSSLWEVKEKAGNIKFDALFRSGLNIGRDIMGTMANTLILAYIGSSLSVVLILSVYSSSLMELFSREMIIVEILQALAGSFGILLAIPLTAFFSATLYLKK